MPDQITHLPTKPQIPAGLLNEISLATQKLIDLNLALLDHVGGDPDIESNGDEFDQSFPWASGPRGHVISGGASGFEDDETDDEDSGGDEAEPDFVTRVTGNGAGCLISDNEHGAEELGEPDADAEREQMADDVPVLPVFAIEPNPFNGKRQLLGYSNLQPTFVSNGSPVEAA
jgi:hypothetical protein